MHALISNVRFLTKTLQMPVVIIFIVVGLYTSVIITLGFSVDFYKTGYMFYCKIKLFAIVYVAMGITMFKVRGRVRAQKSNQWMRSRTQTEVGRGFPY